MKMTKEEKAARKVKREYDKEVKRLQSCAKSEYDRLSKSYVPMPPTKSFKIGDRVEYGNWPHTTIYKIHENGKFYSVIILNPIKDRFSKEILSLNFEITYTCYTDLIPFRKDSQIKNIGCFTTTEYNHISYSQRDIRGLLGAYFGNYAGIDTEVDYQRDFVWTLKQKQDLIRSIFQRIDIGKFTLIKREYKPNEKHYEILDGKQRLNAIVEFFTDQFRYNGSLYSELHTRDQGHFDGYSISWGESLPMTSEQKYKYFLKLNTTGTPIDQTHINKIQREYLAMLKESEKKEDILTNC